MSSEQIASLAFLGLMGAAIAGSYIAANRGNLGRMTQQALIWGMIFVGIIAGYGLWGDISRDVTGRHAVIGADTIQVPRARDGHYYLTLDVNGVPVNFVVDTGASQIVLSQEDARRIGFTPEDLRFLSSAQTANGTVATAPVRLDSVALGPFTDRGLRAVVNGGEVFGSLLGMDYLGLYDRIEIAQDRLVLTR